MTSSTVIDTSSSAAPDATAQRPGPVGQSASSGLKFSGVLRSERIKLSSLRSIRVTLLVTVLVGLGISGLMAYLFRTMSGDGGAMDLSTAAGAQSYLLVIATFSSQFLALVFGVLGVFAISSEYSSGMILSTLAAVPKRTPVFVAKILVVSAVSAIAGLVLAVGALGFAVLFAPDSAGQVFSTPVISGVLGTIGYLVLIALFAFGVAALLRSTAGGISVVTGVVFVLPMALSILFMTGWEWVPAVNSYLPSSLGNVLAQGLIEVDSGPNFWGALAAMAGWVLVALVPAAMLFKRRDAK